MVCRSRFFCYLIPPPAAAAAAACLCFSPEERSTPFAKRGYAMGMPLISPLVGFIYNRANRRDPSVGDLTREKNWYVGEGGGVLFHDLGRYFDFTFHALPSPPPSRLLVFGPCSLVPTPSNAHIHRNFGGPSLIASRTATLTVSLVEGKGDGRLGTNPGSSCVRAR